MRIAREALPFVLPPLTASALCVALDANGLAALIVSLTIALFIAFRDPRRAFDGPPDLVLAPADGRIAAIETVSDPTIAEFSGTDGESVRIVSLLGAFNVYRQRCPCEGQLVSTGSDSQHTNRRLTVMRRLEGDIIGVRQRVGKLGRRISVYLSQGAHVDRGDYLGIARFGAQIELLLPPSYEVMVKVGDRLQGGTTPVAMPTDPSTNPLH